uniref:uncharacterized protein LOC697904 n=1 Tax=Macaca mulatta TaxID=9544 RepID=UPI0010A25DF8|nr:uncharacterized protein LOC697904 [Macaca mulatta]
MSQKGTVSLETSLSISPEPGIHQHQPDFSVPLRQCIHSPVQPAALCTKRAATAKSRPRTHSALPQEDQALHQVQCCLPHCAMGPGLLSWALLCLLGAGESCALDSSPILSLPTPVSSTLPRGGPPGCLLAHPPSAFPTGSVDTGVTQSPTHLIKTRGQQVTLRCSPISGHSTVSWYQQAPGQGPQFIFEYANELRTSEGNFPHRFSGRQFCDYHHSELNVSALELGDSALYLCASSLAQPGRVTGTLCTNLSASVYSSLRADSCEKGWRKQGQEDLLRGCCCFRRFTAKLPSLSDAVHYNDTVAGTLLFRKRNSFWCQGCSTDV